MKASKNILSILALLISFSYCEKKPISPDANQLSFPSDFRAESYYRSIKFFWKPVNQKDVARYKIYYGTASKSYTDTLSVSSEIVTAEINGLNIDQQYFCAIATVDVNRKESERSDEIAVRTYLVFEDFSQADGALDTTKWHYKVGYPVPVSIEKISAAEIQFNDEPMRRSFGQYLKYTPLNDFAVECEFMPGVPNVGGAGLMIRSELANPEKYYKGYNAFIFWNLDNWELHLEESVVDRRAAIFSAAPVKLPDIRSNEWIKLSILYKKGSMEAAVFRLPDYSVLGKVAASDTTEGKRPNESDKYCGFFTSQYGGNIIYADNFGIRRLD